ncbi:MAG: hypothetical protein AAF570_09175 [Bacteroidota bacterium]
MQRLRNIRYRYVYLGMLGLGLLGGFLYWNFWGCTDSCPIDSSVNWSLARGGLIGLCVAAMFHPSKSKSQKETEETA